MKDYDYKVRTATEKDVFRLKEITDKCIGTDYYSKEYIENAIRKKDCDFFVYVNEKDIPVAYLYIFTETYRNAREELHIKEGVYEIDGISDDTVVGVYKTACTLKEYRKTGILSRFLNELEDVLRQQGAECIVFTALKYPDGTIPVDGAVRSVGFEPRYKVEHPWIGIDSYCPYCGRDHCECDAVIYSKLLH